MAPQRSPSDPKKKRTKRSKTGRGWRLGLIENALQIRIGDLLKSFKHENNKLSTFTLKTNGIEIRVTMDFTDTTKPVMRFGLPVFGENTGLLQNIPLKIIRPQLGGWTARFVCSLPKDNGKLCCRAVSCLYLPDPWVKNRFGCNRCHRLEYSSRALTKWRKAKLRKQRQHMATLRIGGKRRSQYVNMIPEAIPLAHWYDNVQYSEMTLALMKLKSQFDAIVRGRFT